MRKFANAFGCAMLLFFAACADGPTTPDAAAVAPRLYAAGPEDFPHAPKAGESPYFCSVSRAVSGKSYAYEYGVRRLRFPPAELSPDGTVTVFRLVSYGGGEVLRRASCMIPNTASAKARVERMFRAAPVARGGTPRAKTNGSGVVIQTVPVEGVDVTVCQYGGEPPHCNYEPPTTGDTDIECPATDQFCGSGGDDGDDWSWGGTGESDSEPLFDSDSTGRPPCRRDSSGMCITEGVDSRELQRIVDGINAMQDSLPECAEAKGYAQELVGQGADRFRVWNGYDKYPDPDSPTGFSQRFGYNSSDARGRILVYDSYWLFEDRTLVAHEALHNYLQRIHSPLLGKANENWVLEWAEKCA